jgi:hypothetical protein
MEDAASGNAGLLVARMKALARRGATMKRGADGAGFIEHSDRRRIGERVSPPEFLRMLDAGWIRAAGADLFVISRRGATALRNHLNRPQATRIPAALDKVTPAKAGHQGQPKAAVTPGYDSRESPLAWLRQRRDKAGKPMISAIEFEAGERLRADFERGHMTPRVTASWDAGAVPSRQARGAPGVGMEMADVVVAARQRVELALQAVGPELSGMLLDVCCFLKGIEQAERNGGWPQRAGKVVLQLGLAHLARHYGLDRQQQNGPARVRLWVAPVEASSPEPVSGE